MPLNQEDETKVLVAANLAMRQLAGPTRLTRLRVDEAAGTYWLLFCGVYSYLGASLDQALVTAKKGDWYYGAADEDAEVIDGVAPLVPDIPEPVIRYFSDRIRADFRSSSDQLLGERSRLIANRTELIAWRDNHQVSRAELDPPGERPSQEDEADLFSEPPEWEAFRTKSVDLFEIALVESTSDTIQEIQPLEGLYQEQDDFLVPSRLRVTPEGWSFNAERPVPRDPRIITRRRVQVVLELQTDEYSEDETVEVVRNVKVYDRRGNVIFKLAGDDEGRVYFQELILSDSP